MKQIETISYTFNASSGIVTLLNSLISPSKLFLIVNTTKNEIIYNFADSSLGATFTTSGPNTVINLNKDTSSHSNTDLLSIIYDDGSGRLLKKVGTVSWNNTELITLSNGKLATPSILNFNPFKIGTSFVLIGDWDHSGTASFELIVQGPGTPSGAGNIISYTHFDTGIQSSSALGSGKIIITKTNTSDTYVRFQVVGSAPASGTSGSVTVYALGLEAFEGYMGDYLELAQTISNRIPNQVNNRIPVEVGNFPSSQTVSGTVTANVTFPDVQNTTLTNSGGTVISTVKPANTPVQASDTALVVAAHPASPVMVGQGGNAVSSSNPLQVSLANTGANTTNSLIVTNAAASAIATRITNANASATVFLRNPSEGITTNDPCLMVKNVNLIRLSGDTFIEDRRPDFSTAGEYNGVLLNQLINIQPSINNSRRIRLFQIMFTFRYQGSSTTSDRGIFHFQWYPLGWSTTGGTGNTGPYDVGNPSIMKARFLSDQTHTLTFPNGIIPPSAGASLRVANVGGGALDLNWNVIFLEE